VLPRPCLLGQVTERQRHVEQVLDPAQQREGGLRARCLRDVVGDRRPERHGRHPALRAHVLQDPHDPGGSLVPGQLDAERAGDGGVGRDTGDRHRSGVRRVSKKCAEGDDHLDLQHRREVEDLLAERAPAHARLDAAHEDDVPGLVRDPGEQEPGGRPVDGADAVAVDLDVRPVDLEVVVVLGVEAGQELGAPLRLEVLDRRGGRVGGVVPARERGDDHRVDQLRGGGLVDHL